MLVRGDFVHCPHLGQLEILCDHLLEVDERGFIASFSPGQSVESIRRLDESSTPTVVIPNGSFLLPTFCDLHLHAPQFLYQGTGLHLPLMQWLNKYAFQAEERLDMDSSLAKRVYKQLAKRLIENGTGAVLLFGTIKEETNIILAQTMQTAGIRAFVGKLSMDISTRPSYVEASSEEALQALYAFTDKIHTLVDHLPPHRRLVEPVVTPRFVPTCSDELLNGLAKMSSSRSLRIQSHLAEAHDQVQWVKTERGVDDMEVFDRSQLLTPRTIQAHCTFLDTSSLSHLHTRGTAVAHCPLSNAYFSAQPFRLREAFDCGVKVGLGTDVAGGYSIDIMSAMRQAVVVSRMREGSRLMGNTPESSQAGDVMEGTGPEQNLAIDWKEALYIATRGGALALNAPHYRGMFEVGASFDAQCIKVFGPESGGVGALDFFDLENSNTRCLSEEMVEKWWCLGNSRNRTGMWVQGESLWPTSEG